MSTADTRSAKLVAMLEQRDETGAYRFTDEAVRALLARAVLTASLSDGAPDLPEELTGLIGELAVQAQVTSEMDAVEVRTAVEEYCRAHPLPRDLQVAYEQLLAALLLEGPGATTNAFRRFLGSERTTEVLQQDGPRPEGTVAANPLARFSLKVPGE